MYHWQSKNTPGKVKAMLLELTTVESPIFKVVSREVIDPTKYIFLVEAIAHKFRKRFGGKFEKIEDTEPYSIALMELVKAAAGYDPEVNEDFSRYAFRSMRNGIVEAIRHRNRQKRTAEFAKLTTLEWQELPEKEVLSADIPSDVYQTLMANHQDDTEQDHADKALLTEIYIQGKKIPFIAEKYGISRMTVYNRLRRIIGKIRQRHGDLIESHGGILDECPEREPCRLH